ncbi:protein ALP1-like [Haliotis rubra]|uniref:protein ALP1-like n=1 Tax=Haliotis rubra TaxID=36100 RepID=UPI001EE53A86|nr:protein ALP1-like [Haliotis rubra]
MVVFDPFHRIIDIVARWPGSTHGSRFLSQSGLFRLMEGNNLLAGCHLLVDSGYPSRRWLLTPFLRPQPGCQTNYNRARRDQPIGPNWAYSTTCLGKNFSLK